MTENTVERYGLPAFLTPMEVAAVVRVDPKTVARWATAGKISSIRTPGGHRRFALNTVVKMLTASGASEEEALALISSKIRK